VEHEPATTAGDPAELIGAHPERDWETLQQSLADLGESVASYRDCGELGRLLDRVRNAAAALDHLEHTLESVHLACCILPAVSERAELWRALARLSARRVGGLVVVEGEQSLDDYIARGTPLDAHLSASLLESLFHPGSALHDGAVIVRGTRVMAAGVFLPVMAERRDPGRGRLIGGRHRAALGLSRLTDALVFVVSEETREISLAVRGQLHAGLHLETSDRRSNSGSGGARRIASMLDRLRSALRSLPGRGSPRRGGRGRRRREPSTDLGYS
jgi:hypothetical protein